MSYDKATCTINIESDDPKDFERDLIAHMAHVTNDVDKKMSRSKLTTKELDRDELVKGGGVMRRISIALNILLLGFVLYMVFSKGMPRDNELFVMLLFFATPISSLFALSITSGESWLRLYFVRKTLEERKRIEALEGR